MPEKSPPQTPIAIVGMAALMPGASDARGFWDHIVTGKDLITDVPPTHWLVDDYYNRDPLAPDQTYCKRGAFLPTVEFDPMEYGMPPNNLSATDPSQLLALLVATKLLEDASDGEPSKLSRSRMSVILGITGALESVSALMSRLQRPVWAKAMREAGLPQTQITDICERIAAHYVPWQEATFPGLLNNVVAGRVANRFDTHGTNMSTDAACASSFSALHVAMNELALGQSDFAIAGGVDTLNDIFAYMCFSKTPALSPTEDCRPFSDAADGTLLGEGVAMFALKRLADAEREGHRIYAVIRGLGSSSDGRHKSIYAPRPEGQAMALRRAYEAAGYGPETVELLEGHGTGTKAGDAAEVDALKAVFEAASTSRRWCALGSVKSQVGHTKGAAGAAGLLKIALALHHKVLPPTIKVNKPNAALGLESSPFYINTQTRPWVRSDAHPRRASVSSFGFGGTNFHLTLEEYTPSGAGRAARSFRKRPTEVVLLSAPTLAELDRQIQAVLADSSELPALAKQTQRTFSSAHASRLAIVADSRADAMAKLSQVATAVASGQGTLSAPGVFLRTGEPSGGQVAFLFPGQGSQYVGMGADLAMGVDAARKVWDAAPTFGAVGCHELAFPKPVFSDEARAALDTKLTATEWAQPTLAVASLAMLDVLKSAGLKPDCFGGHSFGELTALCAADVLRRDELIRLARRRGELMRDAAKKTPGAMLSVKASATALQKILTENTIDAVVANHNGPNEIVVSGSLEAIAQLEKILPTNNLGGATKRLPVAAAFHSPAVAPAVPELHAFLETIDVAGPSSDVFGNSDAAAYPQEPSVIRRRLSEQLAQPVLFADLIEAMYARGVRVFVEVGPGAVLTDMVGRILGDRPHLAVETDRKGRPGITSLQLALGRLATTAGLTLDFGSVSEEEPALKPATPKNRAGLVKLNGSNYGKVYPPQPGAIPPARPAAAKPAVIAAAAAPAPEKPKALNGASAALAPPTVFAAPPPLAPVASGASPSPTQLAWISAYQETERRTAEAHAEFQRGYAENHSRYLKMAETSFQGLMGLLSGAPPVPSTAMPMPRPAAVSPLPSMPPAAPAFALPEPPPKAAAAPTPAPSVGAQVDLQALLLAIIAEKTGYQESLLKMEMDLEADLGIDSIKRVEILAALRDRVPSLPEVNPTEVASLRTLGAVAQHMKERLSAGALPAAAPSPGAKPAVAVPAVDLAALLLTIIAEKTGYQESLLKMDMDLEADLGIDSIKRVEILAALRDRVPSLPEVNPTEVASLRTLGAVTEHMKERLNGGAAPSAATKPVAAQGNVIGNGSGGGVESTSDSRVAAKPDNSTLERRTVEMVPEPACGLTMSGLLSASPIALVDGGSGIAAALAKALGARGVAAVVIGEPSSQSGAIVLLDGLKSVNSVAEAIAVNRDVFRRTRAALSTPGALRAFVTVQDTGGDFGASGSEPQRAWLGGIAQLARTVHRERPEITVKTIDCARGQRTPEQLAAVIADELLDGGSTAGVGLQADGTRLARRLSARPLDGNRLPVIHSRSVVIATGGARGVTAACLIELARAHKPRIALLGRTALIEEPACCREATDEVGIRRALIEQTQSEGKPVVPAEIGAHSARILANREVRATLRALESEGSEAAYLVADVRDPVALTRALDEARTRWGAITALVHGAGVIQDKRIQDKTDEQFDRVFDTKVLGLHALLTATAADPLEWIGLFSSTAAYAGNAGQADYAMANEVLNQVAMGERARRGNQCQVRSLGWGPWEGGMVTPELARHFERLGVPLVSLALGAQAFVAETSTPSANPCVLLGTVPPDDDAQPTTLEVRLDERSHPYLLDHAVGGFPVVPVVLAVEWFLRAAQSVHPESVVSALRKIRVRRGIKLAAFQTGERLKVRCRTRVLEGKPCCDLELLSADETVHYSATAVLADAFPSAPTIVAPRENGAAAIYDGHVLFHGPKFQVLKSILGGAKNGISATLVGLEERQWPNEPWQIDVAAVDGAAQLAGLCGKELLGGAMLPMAIEEMSFFHRGLGQGPLGATLTVREISNARILCDLALRDGADRVLVAGRGLECILRPDAPPASRPSVAAEAASDNP